MGNNEGIIMFSKTDELFSILMNVMKNCGNRKVDTIIPADPTRREVFTMWVGLDAPFEKMEVSPYEEYIEPECYKIRVTSIWGDDIDIYNYEGEKVLENLLNTDGWLRPQHIKVGSRYVKINLVEIFGYILERGTFYASKPKNFKCTCEELGYIDADGDYINPNDPYDVCPHCLSIIMEEAEQNLLASAI